MAGQAAVVIGAGDALGGAIARRFAPEPFHQPPPDLVLVAYRNEQEQVQRHYLGKEEPQRAAERHARAENDRARVRPDQLLQ